MPKFYVICTRNNQGLFTNFLHTLHYLHKAERKSRIPIVYWFGGAYSTKKNRHRNIKGKNIWDYFFEPVSEYSAEKMFRKFPRNKYGQIKSNDDKYQVVFRYRDQGESWEPKGIWDAEKYPPDVCLNNPSREGRIFVHNIIKKHIRIRGFIQKRVDEFYNKEMKKHHVLGVHIRGCNDLQPAQGHKIMTRYIKATSRYIDNRSDVKIFVATDYAKSLTRMKKEFGDHIISDENVKRSQDGNPLQYGSRPKKLHRPGGPQVGEDVIVECLLLSKCNYMIRGFSNVPSCATYFNPDLPSLYICKYNKADRKYLGIK